MSWKDRLRTLEYESPSGEQFTLAFDDLSREVGKKAPVTEFPNQNAGAVQDLGQSTKRYPITAYISGRDYDTEADRFWSALNESGPGVLRHPRFGNLDVVPVSVSQSESFVEGGGRASFRIDFVESDQAALLYPSRTSLSPNAIYAAVDAAAGAAAKSLEGIEAEDPGALEVLKNKVKNALGAVNNAFDTITGVTDSIRSEIQSTIGGIISEIDTLVQAPMSLAQSLITLYRLPARTVTSVKSKIDGYTALANTLADAFIDTTNQYGQMFGLINAASTAGFQIAAAESTVTGEIETRASAANIVESLFAIQNIADASYESSGVVDYELQRASRMAITNALKSLQEKSINLPVERVFTLESDEALLSLVDSLYGNIDSLDSTIDRFIRYNELQGSHIVMVPQGTTVRWYE
jgi:prophage DNA circulation protein